MAIGLSADTLKMLSEPSTVCTRRNLLALSEEVISKEFPFLGLDRHLLFDFLKSEKAKDASNALAGLAAN